MLNSFKLTIKIEIYICIYKRRISVTSNNTAQNRSRWKREGKKKGDGVANEHEDLNLHRKPLTTRSNPDYAIEAGNGAQTYKMKSHSIKNREMQVENSEFDKPNQTETINQKQNEEKKTRERVPEREALLSLALGLGGLLYKEEAPALLKVSRRAWCHDYLSFGFPPCLPYLWDPRVTRRGHGFLRTLYIWWRGHSWFDLLGSFCLLCVTRSMLCLRLLTDFSFDTDRLFSHALSTSGMGRAHLCKRKWKK